MLGLPNKMPKLFVSNTMSYMFEWVFINSYVKFYIWLFNNLPISIL